VVSGRGYRLQPLQQPSIAERRLTAWQLSVINYRAGYTMTFDTAVGRSRLHYMLLSRQSPTGR